VKKIRIEFLSFFLWVLLGFPFTSYAQPSHEIIEDAKSSQCLYLRSRNLTRWSACISEQEGVLARMDWSAWDSLTQQARGSVSGPCLYLQGRDTDSFVRCLSEQLLSYSGLSGTDRENIDNSSTSQDRIDDSALVADIGSRTLTATEIFEALNRSVYMVITGNEDTDEWVQGSAVAVSNELLFTNCHVVLNDNDSPRDVIVLVNESEYQDRDSWFEAEVYRSAPSSDRCILVASQNKTLRAIPIRAFSELQVGEQVLALGYPLAQSVAAGLDSEVAPLTLSSGILSAKRARSGVDQIQTTAFIDGGSSGGALLDMQGRLIGITTEGIPGTALNFAIAAEEFGKL